MTGATFWLGAGAAATGAAALVAVSVQLAAQATQRHGARLEKLTRSELVELFVFVDPSQFVRLNAAALLLLPGLALVLFRSPTVAAALVAALLVAPAAAYRALRRRRRRRLLQQLPDAAASVAASLRAGLALRQALEQVPRYQAAPTAQEFALALREHRLGVPLDTALEALAQRTQLHEYRMLVASLSIAKDLGGGLAEALDRLAVAVRRRVGMEERIVALTAQGRLQGVIVSLLPLVLMAALAWIDPVSMRRLLTTPPGWAALALIALLETGGWLLIRRIVRIDV